MLFMQWTYIDFSQRIGLNIPTLIEYRQELVPKKIRDLQKFYKIIGIHLIEI